MEGNDDAGSGCALRFGVRICTLGELFLGTRCRWATERSMACDGWLWCLPDFAELWGLSSYAKRNILQAALQLIFLTSAETKIN